MAAEKGIYMQEQAGTRMREVEVRGGEGVRTKRSTEGVQRGMKVAWNRKVGVHKSGLRAVERPAQLGSEGWEEGPRTPATVEGVWTRKQDYDHLEVRPAHWVKSRKSSKPLGKA